MVTLPFRQTKVSVYPWRRGDTALHLRHFGSPLPVKLQKCVDGRAGWRSFCPLPRDSRSEGCRTNMGEGALPRSKRRMDLAGEQHGATAHGAMLLFTAVLALLVLG